MAYLERGSGKTFKTAGQQREKGAQILSEQNPCGVTEQDEFLNGVLEMETLLTPQELLAKLHRIEAEANREAYPRGTAYFDLDIPAV